MGEKLDLVATGSLTNIALFSKVFPQMLLDKVERIVLMGGAEGRGNKTAVAESNILCDAHAASIVLDLDVPVVMCVSAKQSISLFLLKPSHGILASQPHSHRSLHSRNPPSTTSRSVELTSDTTDDSDKRSAFDSSCDDSQTCPLNEPLLLRRGLQTEIWNAWTTSSRRPDSSVHFES